MNQMTNNLELIGYISISFIILRALYYRLKRPLYSVQWSCEPNLWYLQKKFLFWDITIYKGTRDNCYAAQKLIELINKDE